MLPPLCRLCTRFWWCGLTRGGRCDRDVDGSTPRFEEDAKDALAAAAAGLPLLTMLLLPL